MPAPITADYLKGSSGAVLQALGRAPGRRETSGFGGHAGSGHPPNARSVRLHLSQRGEHDHELRAGEDRGDLGPVGRQGIPSDLEVAPGSQAAGHGAPDLEAGRGEGALEVLDVGVRGDEVGGVHARAHHSVQGVAGTAAEGEEADHDATRFQQHEDAGDPGSRWPPRALARPSWPVDRVAARRAR